MMSCIALLSLVAAIVVCSSYFFPLVISAEIRCVALAGYSDPLLGDKEKIRVDKKKI
jgi:hypothetical protein